MVFCRIEIARWETATVYVPASNVSDVTESLKKTDNKNQVRFQTMDKGGHSGSIDHLIPKTTNGHFRKMKSLTGQSTQQHIHEKLIEKAKEKLSTTNLSVSEIAYELGFNHPQSFSKLFKNKTNFSPLEFRSSFN